MEVDKAIYDIVLKKYNLYSLELPIFRVFLRNFTRIFWPFDKWEDLQAWYNVQYKDAKKIKKARKFYFKMYNIKYGKTYRVIEWTRKNS